MNLSFISKMSAQNRTRLVVIQLIIMLLGVWVLPVFADAAYALEFDGSNDYVELTHTAWILGQGWEGTKSVNLWVKPIGTTPVCANATPAWCRYDL